MNTRSIIQIILKLAMIVEFAFIFFVWMKNNQVILAAEPDTPEKIPVAEMPANNSEPNINLQLSQNKISDKINTSSEDDCQVKKKQGICDPECGLAYEPKPESERKPAVIFRPAPRPVAVKISCPGYGHPGKSDTKGKHTDEDCCPDPDEWPKPGCIYDAKGYSIMLSGPAKK